MRVSLGVDVQEGPQHAALRDPCSYRFGFGGGVAELYLEAALVKVGFQNLNVLEG